MSPATSTTRQADRLDGLVDLPPGKIAAVATYLEMTRPAAPGPLARAADGPPLQSLRGDLRRYRSLYREIGEPWLWFSRALMTDRALRAVLADPDVDALVFAKDGRDLGLIEFDFRLTGECELAFFGLVPDMTGRGLGPALIAEAVRRAFSRPISRLWLHTCTLDHPAALRFYMKAGFKPYRRAIEIADDPRLSGQMRRGAAPHFPIV